MDHAPSTPSSALKAVAQADLVRLIQVSELAIPAYHTTLEPLHTKSFKVLHHYMHVYLASLRLDGPMSESEHQVVLRLVHAGAIEVFSRMVNDFMPTGTSSPHDNDPLVSASFCRAHINQK